MGYIMCSQTSINRKNIKNPSIYFMVKRLIDFILSLSSIILLMPLFIVIGFLIKRDSKGLQFLNKKGMEKTKNLFIYTNLEL